MYFLYDITEDEKIYELFYTEKDEIIPKLNEFYNFICDNKNTFVYNMYPNNLFLTNQTNPSDVITLDSLSVNQHFLDFFQLELASGTLFSAADYSDIKELTPIILGHSYSDSFTLGDVITDAYNNEYKIIGFLKKDSYYFNFKAYKDIIYLNDTILLPIQRNKFNSFSDYDSIINNSYIYTPNIEDIFNIQHKSNELNLYSYYIRSFSEQLDNIKHDNSQIITLILTLYLIITLFTITSIITYVIQFIESKRYEFAIHVVCGSSIVHLVVLIILQQLILLSIPVFIITLVCPQNILFNFIFCILIIFIIGFVSFKQFNAVSINQILRCK